MKKVLILFVVLISVVYSQENAKSNKLTGNLYVDSQIAYQQTKNDITSQEQIYLENKKSPFLAGSMSLLVPGAGQLYDGSLLKTAIFVAVEAAAASVAIIYNQKGDDQTNLFEDFANANWSVKKYAQWTYDNATRIQPGINLENYKVFNDQGDVNWKELNRLENAIGHWYSHRLAPYGDQQYYEMIGKYPQFNPGWNDFTEDPNNPFNYGDPVTRNFHDYSGMRGKANNLYNVAKWAVIGIVTNHVLSAVEAAWSAGKYNKELKMKLNIKKEQVGFRTDYYPQLSLQIGI